MMLKYALGPPNPTKKFAHWMDLLDQPLYQNHAFEIFRVNPPTPLMKLS